MKVLITGGAGFIGCNLADRLLSIGASVIIFDNFVRPGVEKNTLWLKKKYKKNLKIVKADVCDVHAINKWVKGTDVIYHLAAQVAVTTSVDNPRNDLNINVVGTFNVLEAARNQKKMPIVVYSSTNKVYGSLTNLKSIDYKKGINEEQNLDFHSPYGCCYSADTDILTQVGWKKFYDLDAGDKVLTYNMETKFAEYQKPTNHFSLQYKGKMYVQRNRRLKTCVTPNHKMLVSWDCNHNELEKPRLLEAQYIKGKPMAYLLGAELNNVKDKSFFNLPGIIPNIRYKHHFLSRKIRIEDWLRFFGWYIAEGHFHESKKTGNCTVTLTTKYRTEEALKVMRAIGLTPVVDDYHVVATSKQLCEYLRQFGKSHYKYIPLEIKNLSSGYLQILLQALLDGDGDKNSKNAWRYTTVSRRLADDVQEIAIKCGMSASIALDKQSFYRVYMSTTRTAQCNQGQDRSEWIDYNGWVYCVEVLNSTVMVRQNGHAYFSGNSKGSADQYTRDYYRIYGLPTVVFRQSCVYGEHQMGIEDQGWLAHFVIKALKNESINIFGDGKQIRDLLYVGDLIDVYLLAVKNIKHTQGQVFNIGGGAKNVISILGAIGLIERSLNKKIKLNFKDIRPGDQKIFISDNTKLKNILGFKVKTGYIQGLKTLIKWLQNQKL